jgi:putative ABC transport system permease protein
MMNFSSLGEAGNLASLWQDARYALRLLAKTPGFTLTAVLSLALGIGATTAVFSVIHAVLISPYPYAGADRMVRVLAEDRSGIPRNFFLTGAQLQQFRQLNSVDAALGQANWEFSTTGSDLPEDVRAVFFTANASGYFGVPALLGRGLVPSDAPEGQDPQLIVVLSFSFWKRRFAGDPQIVGKTFSMAHRDYTIVGVLPSRFAWTMADVYLPVKVTNDPSALLWLSCVKLKPGVSTQAAEAEFQPLFEVFAKQAPVHFPENFRIHLQRLTDEHDLTFIHTLYLLFAAVALMFWIGCANFSILLLARGTSRQHEFALRSAIGAPRSRVLHQLLVESLLLSLSGAALGVLAAYAAVALIANWLPRSAFPPEVAIQINLPVLAFTVSLALVAGLLFGLAPALRLSRTEENHVLLSGARTVGFGVRSNRTHGLLVAAQVALTLLLLSGGGAVTEGFLRLMRAPLGYDPSETLVVGIPLRDNTYMTWEHRAAYFDQLRQHIASIPGVLSTAISTRATPPDSGLETRVTLHGDSAITDSVADDEQHVRLGMVSPEYFSLLRIRVLSGRIWDQAETMRGAPFAVINETMARHYWPNGGAVGRSLRFPDLKGAPYRIVPATAAQSFQIIGVVADVRNDGLDQTVKPAVYVPYTLDMEVYLEILVHTNGSLSSVYRAVREQVRSVDADQQVEGHGEIVSLEARVTRQKEWQQARLATILLGAFGLLALVLASVGLYSVVSYGVAQRTNEFGIRIALGAQQRHVLRLVFTSAAASIGSGVAAGILLSFYATKLVAHWTEVSASNPLVLLNATLLFLAAATVACLLPARRATSIDPMEALRRQ